VFDHPVIQRCQLHKIRNVADKLPDRLASTVTSRMRAAYQAESALAAEAQLQALAKVLERTHPGAAGSVREGLAETLTVLRLSVRGTDRGDGPGVSRAQRGAAFMTRPRPCCLSSTSGSVGSCLVPRPSRWAVAGSRRWRLLPGSRGRR